MTSTFLQLLQLYKIPAPVQEFRFDAVGTRRWRWDYCWPEFKVALEVQGGIWTEGRHARGDGMRADMEKFSEAAAQGWRLVLVTPDQLATLPTIRLIQRALGLEVAA